MFNRLPAFGSWTYPDISSALSELKDVGFIRENINGDFWLTNEAIIYMESKSKEFFEDIADVAGDVLTWIFKR